MRFFRRKVDIDAVFPRFCLVCEENESERESYVCASCSKTLKRYTDYCQCCGQQFAAELDYCGPCMESPPSYHSHFCAFSYEGEIESLIKAFKFGNRPSLAKPLAKLFVEAWRDQQDYMLPGCIVAAPLYSRRLRYRGFNQSHLLATQIAAEMEVPYIKDAIEKIRPTESQSSLALRHRESNLKGAFKLKSSLKCNDVAIIDDVVTSGATMNEIANCLVNFGVDYVQAWGLAHTPKKT